MNKKRKKQNKFLDLFFKIIGILSTVIAFIFSASLYLLDMLPMKYLIIIYVIIFILYFLMLLIIFVKKIKIRLKFITIILLILFNLLFTFGIKYIGNTMNFVNVLNSKLLQQEEYYLMALESSRFNDLKQFDDKKIGIYQNTNSSEVIDKLLKKIEFTKKEYTDILEMFEDLKNNKIDGILINNSIKTLLDTELKDLDIELQNIYSFKIFINKKDDIVKYADVTKQTFNIYVAGGDAYGDINNVTNTDVNMVITVDPVNKRILVTSIPRDYYVKLPGLGENSYDKLTHAGYYGIEESIKAVEELLDININYYVKVNFSTIQGVIDAIGGVDVYSDYTFKERAFKKYTFKKGYNHLNGEQALAFARERKAFKDGDIQRVKNQQKVLEAIIDKVTSSTTIITNFSKILDSVSSNVSTNMDKKSMNKFVKMQLNDMSSWNIEKQNLTGYDFYTKETYTFPTFNLYVMKRDDNSVNNAKEKIKELLNKE